MTHDQCMARLELGSHRLAWLRELDRLLELARNEQSARQEATLRRTRRGRDVDWKAFNRARASAKTRRAVARCHEVLGPLSENDYRILWLRDPHFHGSRAWRS